MRSQPSPSAAPRGLTAITFGLLLVAGCGAGEEQPSSASDAPVSADEAAVPIDAEVVARCGCAIEGIGACGNYVLLDGEPLKLEGDLGLGKMEFCGKDDQLAHVAGTMAGGTVEATSFELRD